MKRIGMLVGFLAVLAFLLPLTAQDVKKETDKKEEKKVPDKKEEKKKEKFVYGLKFATKIVTMKAEGREFTVEWRVADPKRVYDNNVWAAQRQQQLAQQYAQALQQTNFQTRASQLQSWQSATFTFQRDLAQRQSQVYVTKNVEVRAHDTARVRSMILPIEFDDQGFQKKWTKKEIEARKDKTGLPGYFASEFDALKQGQRVEIYMAKVAPAAKTKKKGPADDDPGVGAAKDRPEFVLMVILQEPK